MDGWMDGGRNKQLVFQKNSGRFGRSVGRTEVSRRDRERNACRTRRGRVEATKRGRNTAQDSVTDVGDGRLRVASDTASNAEPAAFSFPTLPSTTVDGLYLSQKFLVGATRVVSTVCASSMGVCRTRRLPATHPRRSEAPPPNSYLLVRQASPAATMPPNGLFYVQLTLTLPCTEP
jgi:hypothetical protein